MARPVCIRRYSDPRRSYRLLYALASWLLASWLALIDFLGMRAAFFAESEARSHVGECVQALRDFPSVPAGTVGRVVRARRLGAENWVVRVEWALPRRISHYFATIVHLSFNLQKRSRPVTDEFSKDEFERLLGCSPAIGG